MNNALKLVSFNLRCLWTGDVCSRLHALRSRVSAREFAKLLWQEQRRTTRFSAFTITTLTTKATRLEFWALPPLWIGLRAIFCSLNVPVLFWVILTPNPKATEESFHKNQKSKKRLAERIAHLGNFSLSERSEKQDVLFIRLFVFIYSVICFIIAERSLVIFWKMYNAAIIAKATQAKPTRVLKTASQPPLSATSPSV